MSSKEHNTPQVVWFKRDLRIYDHASLFHASQKGQVIPLYIVEPFLFEKEVLSKRHLNFIYESLVDLKHNLQKHQLDVYVYVGDALSCFDSLKQELGSFELHAHMEHGTEETYQRDMNVHAWCKKHGITFNEYKIFGVNRARNFKHRLKDFHAWIDEGIYPIPKSMQLYKLPDTFGIQTLSDMLQIQATGEPITFLKGGETEAIKHAKAFFKLRYKKYQMYIHKPALSKQSSSLLSPYLAFGNLSIRMLHIATRKHIKETEDPFLKEQLKAFEKRLYWHCHFIQRVEKHPEINHEPWDKRLEGLRDDDTLKINAFKEGKTGFPLIDAIMIALQKRGWVNFKQRAIVASFATNVLLIDWKIVGHILQQLFIDYEPGIHWSQIQMQAGLNPFRHVPMYDIIKQSLKDDPYGRFIQEMIPSLKHIDMPDLATPWLLENNPYIKPIIDLDETFKTNKKQLYERKKEVKKPLTLFD